jgi:hypothetical protein
MINSECQSKNTLFFIKDTTKGLGVEHSIC